MAEWIFSPLWSGMLRGLILRYMKSPISSRSTNLARKPLNLSMDTALMEQQ